MFDAAYDLQRRLVESERRVAELLAEIERLKVRHGEELADEHEQGYKRGKAEMQQQIDALTKIAGL